MSLNSASAAPPRRALSSASIPPTQLLPPPTLASRRRFRPPPSSSTSISSTEFKDSNWDTLPSLLSALPKSTASSALLAGKALLIATTLVGVGAFGVVSAVKHYTGAHTVPEFTHFMRHWTSQHLRPITDRIHRDPETEEERTVASELAAFGVGDGETEGWTWEGAEKRIKRAYEEGGFTLWAQVALRELEAEARVERERRRQEVAAEAALRSHSSSSQS